MSTVDHYIWNEMRDCLRKCDNWLPSYARKNILGPFVPNLQTRSQSLAYSLGVLKIIKSIFWAHNSGGRWGGASPFFG